MGLDHWNDSDAAADFVSNVIKLVGDECLKQVKIKENTYNTDGCVNVALFAEDFLKDLHINKEGPLYAALNKAVKSIGKNLLEVMSSPPWRDKAMHVKAYRRMIKNLNKILSNAY